MPVIWYPPIVSPAERIGSTAAPGATGTRYAGLAVLKPGPFFAGPFFAGDAPPATVNASAPIIAARAVSRFIRAPLSLLETGRTLPRRAVLQPTSAPGGRHVGLSLKG